MSKTLIPQNDRVLIKPIDEGEQMYGNIVIPDMGKEKPEMGLVLQVGPGRLSEFGKMIPVRSCKVNDIVLKYNGKIYLAKDSIIEKEKFKDLNHEFYNDEFLKLRKKSNYFFNSLQSKRLGL